MDRGNRSFIQMAHWAYAFGGIMIVFALVVSAISALVQWL